MEKADMHCHSYYSEYQSQKWFQKLGMHETYSIPDLVYRQAKKRGMDFVTLTDNNCMDGVLLLKEKHPRDVITGVEATTAFPEDNCKMHILVWGLNESQFKELTHFNHDIYQFRAYLLQQKLAYSVAHPSFAVNGRLNRKHLEKLLLLFDIFEGINGRCSKLNNEGWMQILAGLTPSLMEDLYAAYRIEPCGSDSWKKGITAGSDDKSDLFLGDVWTEAEANDQNEFLQQIKDRVSVPRGIINNYQAIAYKLYKMGTESKSKSPSASKTHTIKASQEQNVFDSETDFGFRFKIKTMSSNALLKVNQISRKIFDMPGQQLFKKDNWVGQNERLFELTAGLIDSYLKGLLTSMEANLKGSRRNKSFRIISKSLPGIASVLPYFFALKDMPYSRDILTDLKTARNIVTAKKLRRTLWFSDTINDMNGVSVILQCAAKAAIKQGRELKLVSCQREEKLTSNIPDNYVNLPCIYDFLMPFDHNYFVRIPSILKSLKLIEDYRPDQIIISTPGTMGLLGMLAAKIMQVDCIVIYHTDIILEAEHIIDDEYALEILRSYERWFHNLATEIRVPTAEYLRILSERDIRVERTKLLPKGIENDIFIPLPDRKNYLTSKLGVTDGVTLFYAGRISQDKSLDLMAETYKVLVKDMPELNLIIAGNGAYTDDLKRLLQGHSRVFFTGSIPREDLVHLYNAADFFIFPSVTDTFGLVVIEAQACGLPAIVSAEGGPQEVIIPGQTGYIVPNQRLESWVYISRQALDLFKQNPAAYQIMREQSRATALAASGWESMLNDLCGERLV